MPKVLLGWQTSLTGIFNPSLLPLSHSGLSTVHSIHCIHEKLFYQFKKSLPTPTCFSILTTLKVLIVMLFDTVELDCLPLFYSIHQSWLRVFVALVKELFYCVIHTESTTFYTLNLLTSSSTSPSIFSWASLKHLFALPSTNT